MKNKKLKEKCQKIEKFIEEGNLKQAQIQIEELQKRISLIDTLNCVWGEWRTNFVEKDSIELKAELEQLKLEVIVLNENFEKNIEDLKEYDLKID